MNVDRNIPPPSECIDASQSNAMNGLLDWVYGAPQCPAGYAFDKQVMDYSLATISIVLLVPLLALIALAIKLDSPGPIFFRQPRRGLQNRTFILYKFRSMHTEFSDINASLQTCRDDPRVTRIGRWMRRFSLDELPQLINVLRGEMSLVGPRPHALNMRVEGEQLNVASGEYLMRYSVKPGITGWAQVNGLRGAILNSANLQKRLDSDLQYIRDRSVSLDLKILVLTVIREIISKNAF